MGRIKWNLQPPFPHPPAKSRVKPRKLQSTPFSYPCLGRGWGEGGGQPRPQGFSLKKKGWDGMPHPFFKGKALGTRLGGGGVQIF